MSHSEESPFPNKAIHSFSTIITTLLPIIVINSNTPQHTTITMSSSSSLVFFFLLLVFHYTTTSAESHPDTTPLLIFKSITDPTNSILTTWTPLTNPCTNWFGITCLHNRVTRLVLENSNLNSTLPPNTISSLTKLRVLSLKHNAFSGQLPDLSNLTNLKLLFLSNNNFSGDIPLSISSLTKLYRLDLSFNAFSGVLPLGGLNKLTHLLTLRLEGNKFVGPISGLRLSGLEDFNVSGNGLEGEIPSLFSGFPVSVFFGNSKLCGKPLEECERAGGGGFVGNTVVGSSPSAMPKAGVSGGGGGGGGMSLIAIIGIIVGDVLVLGLVSLLLYCCLSSRSSSSNRMMSGNVEKVVYSSPNVERGKMVFLEGGGERRFELEDLLRASAEMLGKGGFGTAYKAILDDGNVVAVKRLKDLSVNGKKEFEQQMEVLGRLRHHNLVGLKAYYFARDEKLLVYEYMPNGNLFWLLHGNRGPGRTPLDWATRLKIASGAARGLSFIHNACTSLRLVHGNIKSTNILIDRTGAAKLSDFGLSVFASPSSLQKSNGYRAPEAALDGRKLTQKSDVYSFGVLLLELLTGKCPFIVDNVGPASGYVDLPRWVQSVVREEWTAEVFDLELMRYKDIEEEMVGLLQIAMACTHSSPDQRLKMTYVVKMIDELRGVEVSPSHDARDSVSDSPSVSEETCRASE